MIPALPPPLATASVPRFFTPTALAAALDCRLRLVLQSSSRGPKGLPAGPAAALGTLTHRFLDARDGSVEPSARLFDRIHGNLAAELAADPTTMHFADLQQVLGLPAWSRFRFDLIDRPADSAQKRPARSLRSAPTASASILGRERGLANSRLRLKGRADRITRLPDGTVEIRDYKTGEVLDPTGALVPAIVLQLRCYGLIAVESFADSPIRLIVDDGADHEVPFSSADRRKLKRHLADLGRDLPEGRQLAAAALASPGESCGSCPFRHRCNSYLATAPRWWQATTPGPSVVPRDVWGEVAARAPGIDGTLDLVLLDASGRRVRVDRLDPARWSKPPDVGDRIWAFNLESPISRSRARAASLHPTVFHECPADSTQNRAWALQLFSC